MINDIVELMAENMGNIEVEHGAQTITSDMTLPGFRFHPTEEELVGYYLRRMVQGRRNSVELIASLDLYQYDPWELPAMAFMGEKEWLFFCPRDKKYPNGVRPNRVTSSGYWKATGTDRAVRCTADFRCIGLKKTLVFYTGRAPRGNKTDWIMNEYRMPKLLDRSSSLIAGSTSAAVCNNTIPQFGFENFSTKNDVALCRIYRKPSSASTAGHYLHSAPREDVGQQLVPTQKHISDCGQRAVLDSPLRILQDFRTAAPAAPLYSGSPSSHQVFPATVNSVQSSHALMARLVEETCCYDGCSSSSNMFLDNSSTGQPEESRMQLQDALCMEDRLPDARLPSIPEHLAMAKMEGTMGSSPRATMNTATDEHSIESKRSCNDIFQHLRHGQHLEAELPLDLLRSTGTAHPAPQMKDITVRHGCCTPPQQSATAGLAEDQQSNAFKVEAVQSPIQSRNQTRKKCPISNDNTGAYSRLLQPTVAQYWRHIVQPSSNCCSSREPLSAAQLEPDDLSSFAFPL